MKTLRTLTLIDANDLLLRVLQAATQDRGKPVSVAVVDVSGNPLLAHRMDGASADSFLIALNKGWTAVRGGKDTVEYAHTWSSEGKMWLSGWLNGPPNGHRADDNRRAVAPNFCSWAGGVVIHFVGDGVGGLAASGRDQLDDHALVDGVRQEWEAIHAAGS